jgi:pimeloyl-ACP methyl ester carboxylesterase
MKLQFASVSGKKTAYTVSGSRPAGIVIEMGLLSCMGEWQHIADRLSQQYGGVLLYERAGVGLSEQQTSMRTPRVVAEELKALLDTVPHEDKLIFIAHSQGGLYAQQFARLYPGMVKGMILLDPLSACDNRFKQLLTPEEYKKSGVDKFANLKIIHAMAKLRLGFIIKALMKSAPPFYYKKDFSQEDKKYFLDSLVKPASYQTAMEEYRLAHEEAEISGLKTSGGFPDIPLVLITHSSAVYEKEIMEFGGTTKELAHKIESVWQSIMKEYLTFSDTAKYLEAKGSGHYIHLSEPDLLEEGIAWICENS